MLTYALISFCRVLPLLGLVLAASVLRGALAPWALSLVHAALGATGLVLLLISVLNGAAGLIPIALGALIVAALGGFYLAFLHLQNKPAPSGYRDHSCRRCRHWCADACWHRVGTSLNLRCEVSTKMKIFGHPDPHFTGAFSYCLLVSGNFMRWPGLLWAY